MAEIGARLREARMRARIDINEVEVQTKIRAKYLRAIENEEWDLLPGDVYARSFLRTYGEYLGLDTRALLDDYRRQYESPSDHELRPITPSGRDRDRAPRGPRGPGGVGGARIPSWAIIGVVLIAVVAALYIVGRQGGPNKTGTGTSASHSTRKHHPRRHAKHRPAPPSTATRVKLQLVPTGQVYVCLVDGTGKPLIPGVIYSPGQTIPVKSASKLLLTLGNASVQMKVNGVSVPVTASSGAIGYELLPQSRRLLAASQEPRCA
jgi:hypothetical protein